METPPPPAGSEHAQAFEQVLQKLQGRGRPLSGEELGKLDEALNDAGLGIEILAGMLDDREGGELDEGWRIISRIISAEDRKAAAAATERLHSF